MKKKLAAAVMALAFCVPLGGMGEASSGLGILGRVLADGIFRSQRTTGTTKTTTKTTTKSSRANRYKNAMGALENLQWVGVAKSSGGNIYFDQDTLKDETRNGQRHVLATVKNEFTEAGAKAVAKSSDGLLDEDDVAYSLFLVDFGENSCFVASHVTYYDKKGKKLVERTAPEAFTDVTSMNYGKTYGKDSIESKMKTQVFHYADRVKEEEKEKAEQNG